VSKDGQRANELLFATSSLDKAKRIFDRFVNKQTNVPPDGPAA
jgi:hypothetical protein